MGIQIYIEKDALKEAGVGIKYSVETQNYACSCGQCENGVCMECGGESESFTETYAELDGLDKVMGTLNNVVYHDANHYGSSRKPILEFIEKHKLKAGSDWYEA